MILTSELYLYFQQKLKNKFMQKTVLRKITLKIIFMSFVARVTYYVKFFAIFLSQIFTIWSFWF